MCARCAYRRRVLRVLGVLGVLHVRETRSRRARTVSELHAHCGCVVCAARRKGAHIHISNTYVLQTYSHQHSVEQLARAPAERAAKKGARTFVFGEPDPPRHQIEKGVGAGGVDGHLEQQHVLAPAVLA
eukprot:4785491-Pleurochrysis_carterae.AAC.1